MALRRHNSIRSHNPFSNMERSMCSQDTIRVWARVLPGCVVLRLLWHLPVHSAVAMTIGTTQDSGKLRLVFDAITTMTLWMVCLLDWKVLAFLFHAKCTWPNTAATGYKCRTREWAHGINHAENTMGPLLLLLVYVLVHYKTGGKQSSSVISNPKPSEG